MRPKNEPQRSVLFVRTRVPASLFSPVAPSAVVLVPIPFMSPFGAPIPVAFLVPIHPDPSPSIPSTNEPMDAIRPNLSNRSTAAYFLQRLSSCSALSSSAYPGGTPRPPNHAQRMVSTPAAPTPLSSCSTSYFVPRVHTPSCRLAPSGTCACHPFRGGCLTGLFTVLAPVSLLLDFLSWNYGATGRGTLEASCSPVGFGARPQSYG
jgi:hypothetical protein